MESGLLTVSANGIDAFGDYLNIIRDRVPELDANGVEYEEHDRREPIITGLLIAIATGVMSGGAGAIVKTILELIGQKVEKQPPAERPQIQVLINNAVFDLPADLTRALDQIAKQAGGRVGN